MTLYRNSGLSRSLRIHFASFDARERGNYNLSNCQMTARTLNANVAAQPEREGATEMPQVGFWCEVGGFRENGLVPDFFDNDFPTDAR